MKTCLLLWTAALVLLIGDCGNIPPTQNPADAGPDAGPADGGQEVLPRLYVIRGEQMQHLINREEEDNKLFFDAASETLDLENLNPGDVIVSSREWVPHSQKYETIPPRRVNGRVAIDDGKIGLVTEPASIIEALKVGGATEGEADITAWTTTEGPKNEWVILPTQDITLWQFSSGSTSLAITLRNSRFAIRQPQLVMQIQSVGGETTFDLDFRGQIDLHVEPEITISGDIMRQSAEISLLPIKPMWAGQAMIGPLPVVVVAEVDLKASAEVQTGSVSATFGAETSAPLEVSVHYDSRSGRSGWTSSSSCPLLDNPYFHFAPAPSARFHSESGLRVSLAPEITLKLYALVGPKLTAPRLYLGYTLAPEAAYCQTIRGGVSGEFAFVDVDILDFDISVGEFTLFDWAVDLWRQGECGPGFDSDWDGYTVAEGDCDDHDPGVHPGARELCQDGGIDNDCDGAVDEDCEVCDGRDNDGDGLCDEGFACCRGATETRSCGFCGTQSRSCNASCSWGTWSTCSGSGVCSPGTVESRSCPCGGAESRTCDSSCVWGSWSGCSTACSPGATRSCVTTCNSAGRQTCTADGCSWGVCVPPAETCNGLDDDCDGQIDEGCASCPPVVTVVSAGPWEGNGWYDLVLDINLNGARSYECIALDWNGSDTAGASSVRYSVYGSGTQSYALGAYCINSNDTLQSVFACGCSGYYLVQNKQAIIDGTYDRAQVTFRHLTPIYDCP